MAAFGAVAAELESSGFDVQLSAFVAPLTTEAHETPSVAEAENETTVFIKVLESDKAILASVAVDATNWEALVKKLSSGGDKKVSDTQAVLAGIAVDATNWDALIRKLSSGTNKAQPNHSESENPVYS